MRNEVSKPYRPHPGSYYRPQWIAVVGLADGTSTSSETPTTFIEAERLGMQMQAKFFAEGRSPSGFGVFNISPASKHIN